MFGSYGSIVGFVDLDTTKLDMGVTRAAAGLKGLESGTASVGKAFKALAVGGAVVGAVIAGASVKMAADFDESMRKVWSLTRESEATFNSWKSSVKELSRDMPQSATQMADAFYWIKSNMPDATDSQQLKTLDIAARGAVGGVAELSDTVQALTGAQNAYKDMDPAKYMDIMNKAVERGSLTLQDFVSNQGKFIGTAAQFKIPFEEVAAAFATLTRNAVPADTAAMAINQTMMAYLKPTEDAAQVAQNYGIELSANTLRTRGFGGAMLDLAGAMKDDNSEIAQMFPNIRSLKAVLPLSGLASQEFAKDLNEVGNAAGTTTNMFEKNKGSLQNIMKTVWGKFQLIFIDLGEKIIPKLESALDAVGRILDGENDAWNTFAGIVKQVAGVIWDVVTAALKLTPLLIGLGAAFATIKVANFAAVLGGLSGLSGVFGGGTKGANAFGLALASAGTTIRNFTGFAGQAAMTGGKLGGALSCIAASASGLATAFAMVGIGIAALTYKWYSMSKAGNQGWDTIRKSDKSYGELGLKIKPLVDRYTELEAALQKATAAGTDSVAIQNEMTKVGNEIAALNPLMAQGFDEQGNAIMKTDAELRKYVASLLAYSKIKVDTKGEVGQLQALIGKQKQYTGAMEDWRAVLDDVGAALDNANIPAETQSNIMSKLSVNVKAGAQDVQAWMDLQRQTGQMSEAQQAGILSAMAGVSQAYIEHGGSLTDLQKKYQAVTQAASEMRASVANAALQAGLANTPIAENVLSAFKSVSPEMRQFGADAVASWIAGMLQQSGATGDLAAMAQDMANLIATGADWDGTGEDVGEKIYDNIKAQLKAVGIEIKPTVDNSAVEKGKKDASTGWLVPGIFPTVDNKNVDDGKKEAGTGWPLPWITPTVDESNVKEAKARLTQPWWLQAFVQVTTQVNPEFDHPYDAGVYIAEQLGAGASSAKPSVAIGAALDDLNAAWTAMNATALPGWSTDRLAPTGDMSLEDWDHINEAIANLGGNVAANLNSWWAMNGAMIEAKKEMEGYTAAIEKAEDHISALTAKQTKLQAQETELNASIQAHKDTLSELSSMKIAGETAAEDKSFDQSRDLQILELERLKIQQKARAGTATDADYNRLFVIAQKKQELELEHQITDTENSINYDEKHRELEKLLDPLKGQEKTYEDIASAIKAEQSVIAAKEKQLKSTQAEIKEIQRQIDVERAKVDDLKSSYDRVYKSVTDFSTKINEMANNFRARYDEMIAKAKELADAVGGGRTGGASASATLAAGSGRTMSEGNVTSTSTSTTSVSYFYFDKLVLPDVQDVPSLTSELRLAKLRMSV
jgi:TP901 family phage tail tape measure protein